MSDNRTAILVELCRIMRDYGLDVDNAWTNQGTVAQPGKLESEPIETLYFYDQMVQGFNERIGSVDFFDVDPTERQIFGFADDIVCFAIEESDQGFYQRPCPERRRGTNQQGYPFYFGRGGESDSCRRHEHFLVAHGAVSDNRPRSTENRGETKMIASLTRIYVRRYTDSDQVTAYVEWTDLKGRSGRTEGALRYSDHSHGPRTPSFGAHMHALFARGKREGLKLQRETW